MVRTTGGGGSLQVATRGDCTIAFSGWLANREDIRLPASPADGPTVNDAELIANRFSDAGPSSLTELRGRFAVVVWNGAKEELTAARDPMGTHPLFWAASGSTILLSDSITRLIAHGGVSREIDRVACANHFRQEWPSLEDTFYRAVKRVPSGYTLRHANGATRLVRSWSPRSGREHGWASPAEVDEFDTRFAAAVQRCLAHDQVGIWLSGGLDSVSVAAFAADQAKSGGCNAPLALSLRFPDSGVDEGPTQRRVAGALDLPLVILGLDEAVAPKGVLGAALGLAADWSVPMLNPWLPAYLSLSQHAREAGCKAILTGEGGDEWLGVTPYLAADLLAAGSLVELARLAAVQSRSFQMPLWRTIHSFGWRYGLRPLLTQRVLAGSLPKVVAFRRQRRQQRSIPNWLAPDPAVRAELTDQPIEVQPIQSFYDYELAAGLDHPLTSIEFEHFYEAGQRLGMPILSPFLDADLVEFLYRIPPKDLLRGGRTKGMVRSMLNDRFPGLAFSQQKKVLATNTLERILHDEGPSLWGGMGGIQALAEMGVVDAGRIQELATAVLRSGTVRQRWNLFTVQLFEQFARSIA